MQIIKNTRLMRYLGVACAVVLLELVTFQLIYILSTNYITATILSFGLAVILNWVFSRKFVFGASRHHPAKEFTLILSASLVGVAIQLAVVYLCTELLLLYPLIGKVASIAFSFFWNYWFRAAIIFKQPHDSVKNKAPNTGLNSLLSSPLSRFLIGTALVGVCALILYLRFPNNITAPNFYGEDGSVLLQNILEKGWFEALLTPFNGYFIMGLYALCGVADIINAVIGKGLFSLSQVYAVVAVGFMTLVIALPYFLFRKTFGAIPMLLVVLCSALLPLPLSPHIVIGTIGNQKWIFLYLATLLVIYRLIHLKKLSLAKIVVIDSLILLSAYTNSTVYALVPLLYLPHLIDIWKARHAQPLLKGIFIQLRSRAVQSLLLLSALLLPQILYIALNGIPKLPGYLDTPFQFEKATELFINRTYLFGITHMFNSYLNDAIVIVLFGLLLYGGWKKLRDNARLAFLISIYSAAAASLLFVLNRPGVTDFFFGYAKSGSGPDQFFYAQTLIMYLPIILVIFAVLKVIKEKRWQVAAGSIIFLVICGSGVASNAQYGEQWRNLSIFENTTGTFIDQAKQSCAKQHGELVNIVVYPYPDGRFAINVPSDSVCNATLNEYQPQVVTTGLEPFNNNHLAVTPKTQFQQTFIATQNKLSGIRIFLSNFAKEKRAGVYTLNLLDSDCKTTLRTSPIPEILADNSFYNARFSPVPVSQSQKFCFTLSAPTPFLDPLAIQMSAPDTYLDGDLQLIDESGGRSLSSQDVVFAPLYDSIK